MTTSFTFAARCAAASLLLAGLLSLVLAGPARADVCTGPVVVDPLVAPAAPVAPATATIARGAIAVSATVNTPCEDASLLVQAKLRQDGIEKASVTLTPSVIPGPGVTSLTASGALVTPGAANLADGLYAVEVVASETGRPADTSSSVALLVDNTAPAISFTGGPAEGQQLSAGQQIAWTFAAADDLTAPVAFRCAYDAAPLGDCTAAASPGGLAAGTHTFRVEGTDGAGNVAAISRAFSVAPPAVVEQPIVAPIVTEQKPGAKCRVPNLRGLTLDAAKRKLKARGCSLGKVTKPPKRVLALFPGAGKLRVQRQSVKAGSVRAGGQKVGLALVQKHDLKLAR